MIKDTPPSLFDLLENLLVIEREITQLIPTHEQLGLLHISRDDLAAVAFLVQSTIINNFSCAVTSEGAARIIDAMRHRMYINRPAAEARLAALEERRRAEEAQS